MKLYDHVSCCLLVCEMVRDSDVAAKSNSLRLHSDGSGAAMPT